MSAFQASMRALCELDMAPDIMVDRLNKLLCRRFPDNRFVTFFYGLLDPSNNSLVYINAGHCPPWVIQPGKEPLRLLPTGGPLGLFPTGHYVAQELRLEPGSVLVCYSDGVTEAIDRAGEEFGETRLVDLVGRFHAQTPVDIVKEIGAAITSHYAGANREDDVTLVVLKRAA